MSDSAGEDPEARVIDDVMRPTSPVSDPLAALIAELKEAVLATGLSDGVIEAELAAYNAENRL